MCWKRELSNQQSNQIINSLEIRSKQKKKSLSLLTKGQKLFASHFFLIFYFWVKLQLDRQPTARYDRYKKKLRIPWMDESEV
jgi:hypothetical protein